MPAPTVITAIDDLRRFRAQAGAARQEVGLVPTMGALHRGHATLITESRRRDALTIVSIFINPLQFDRREDLDRYPRTLEADLAVCADLGVHAVFAPTPAEMYPSPPEVSIEVGRLADHLCGASRPGHFAGVATVVMKLLQLVQPHRAYFGEKDAQQLAIVRRLASDFNVATEMVGLPTVRDADGLALSSRNTRLSPDGRRRALALPRALATVREAIRGGATATAAAAAGRATLPADPDLRLDYLSVVDPGTMQPVDAVTGPVLVAGALWVEGVRLIDNMTAAPEQVE